MMSQVVIKQDNVSDAEWMQEKKREF